MKNHHNCLQGQLVMKIIQIIVFLVCFVAFSLSSNLDEELISAIEANNQAEIWNLLEKGANINFTDSNGITPLMHAVLSSPFSLVSELVQRNAKINAVAKNGMTALTLAYYKDDSLNSTLIVNLLLNSSNFDEDQGEVEKKKMKDSPIVYGITPLLWAVYEKDFKKVNRLIKRHSNVNAVDRDGRTALMLAVRKKASLKISRILLDNGARVDFVDKNGENALIHSLEGHNPKIIQLLLDHDANVNSTNKDGSNVLSIALSKARRFSKKATQILEVLCILTHKKIWIPL